jgi:hypothetical protein
MSFGALVYILSLRREHIFSHGLNVSHFLADICNVKVRIMENMEKKLERQIYMVFPNSQTGYKILDKSIYILISL